MVIPAHVEQLHETHVALGEAAREETIRRVGAGRFHLGSVEVENALRFAGNVRELGHAGLHAEGHLVLRDARLDVRVAERGVPAAVERGEFVERFAARGAVHAGGIREIQNGIARVAELHALMLRRQKAAAPQAVVERLIVAAARAEGREHHVGGQVLIFAAEAVTEPRTHARTARELMPGLEKSDRGIVIDRVGVHRADEAQFVRDAREVRHQFGQPRSALAVLRELENARRDGERLLARGHRGEALTLANGFGQLLFASRGEVRFGVEQIHLRRRAGLEKVDHALGLRGVVRKTGETHIGLRRRARCGAQ